MFKIQITNDIFVDVIRLLTPLALILLWLALDALLRCFLRHITRAAISRVRASDGGDIFKQSLEYRMKTIHQLTAQLLRVLLGVAMIFWILGSIGIDLRPVIAGIGVVGLGISLAAQNIIRDYINGFIILVEDQYNVGDWIAVNSLQGTVELFTLRATRLRDIEGSLVIIPNNLVQTVVNYTKDWSVALVKVSVTYESDYRKAREIVIALGEEMAKSREGVILGAPNFNGITDFGASSVDMRILIKTQPGMQWSVSREYRERLKERFDAEGIEFAYPQMVVHPSKD